MKYSRRSRDRDLSVERETGEGRGKRKERHDENGSKKKYRFEDVAMEVTEGSRAINTTSSTNLSLDALAQAKKVLQMRKELQAKPTSEDTSSTSTSAGLASPVSRAQETAARLGFRQAPVLRVDALGREIDEHGNVINVTKPSNLSTLKVNINKHKKDAFQILKPQPEVNNPYFDPRMDLDKTKILRPRRRNFQFVEEGKWTRDAENLKMKNQFGEAKARELKVKQAHLAKAKDDINPNFIEVSKRFPRKEKLIPDVEWWDANVLINEGHLKLEKLTHYIEHPRPIEPPAEPAHPPPQPLKLTKREQKKLRTQRRLAKEKEKQEMIRQGLLEQPKPMVKMSNLMKVLGCKATQDPTKLEKEIRTAAAEREQAHMDRNAARKLTPAEKREKKERKLFDDPTTVETIVSVYKINNFSHPKTRVKVEMNARDNRLTGCSVMTEGMRVVVVEGKSKAIKRYGKLMRINLEEAVKEEKEKHSGNNKCCLVWQGSVGKPNFHRFIVQECLTESAARRVFSDAGVAHYWDLAVNYSH